MQYPIVYIANTDICVRKNSRLLELLLHLAQKDQTNQKNPEKHPDNPLRCIHYRGGTGGTTVVRSRV